MMTKKWITNARDRASKKYLDMHEQLKADVKSARKPSLANKSAKQVRHFAKSELHRMYGDTP